MINLIPFRSMPRLVTFIFLCLVLFSCSTNRFSITENLNISEEVTASIPLGSNQIVAVVYGMSAEKLYDMILDILIEEGYRVSITLENKLILGTDYSLEKLGNGFIETHRLDVTISETDMGSEAVFSGVYIMHGDALPHIKVIEWGNQQRSKFYFASMLEIARYLPVREIRYERID
jgi:hypothetical protein